MTDKKKPGYDTDTTDPLIPLNVKKKTGTATAVAIKDGSDKGELPKVIAAGREKLAEQILEIAFEQGIKVREDAALAEMLAAIEIDSPIPSEAFLAIAEILSYVYRANGEPNPFDAVLKETLANEDEDTSMSEDKDPKE